MSVKLLAEHHLEFPSLKGGCTCSSESTLVKMPHCLKSHVVAQILLLFNAAFSNSHITMLNFLIYQLFTSTDNCLKLLESKAFGRK